MEVPPSKLHHKLLQATRVIIQLVKEKELLLDREKALRRELHRLLKGEERAVEERKGMKTDRKGGAQRDHSSIVAANACGCGSTAEERVCQPLVKKTREASYPAPREQVDRPLCAHDRGEEGGGVKEARRGLRETQASSRPVLSPSLSPPPLATRLPPTDLSLSPLKFSDSSAISTLQAAEKALKMVDMGSPLPPSPAHTESNMAARSSTPVEEEEKENVALSIQGNRVPPAGRGRGREKYVPPKLKKPLKVKVRNYNIKE